MTYLLFLSSLVVALAALAVTRPTGRTTAIAAGVVLTLELASALLLAPTQATDCGRCSFGQELLSATFFAVLPGALVGLLLWWGASELRHGQRGHDRV